MTKRRNKTIPVDSLLSAVNYFNIHSADNEELERQTLCGLAESLLLKHNSYRGFRYLIQSEVGEGKTPGIRYDNDKQRSGCLEYRRSYM